MTRSAMHTAKVRPRFRSILKAALNLS
jgi:hypothetical protein